MSSTQAETTPNDYAFKPEQYLEVLDEFEEKARDDSVFVPEEFTKRDGKYVRAYVSRRYNAYMEEYIIPGIVAMRKYLSAELPAESKEFETLIYFKHRARGIEGSIKDATYTLKLRYHPEELLDGYNSDEDDEDRWNRQEYLDTHGEVIPAPPSTDPVETDPQWEDIDDYVREYALTVYVGKLETLYDICSGAEAMIRGEQRIRQKRADRIKRGVKQIVKNDGNHYIIREIPIADPIPEGFRLSY
jgi:hypothetical protein